MSSREAIEFAEWANINAYSQITKGVWKKLTDDSIKITTNSLYTLFTEQRAGEAETGEKTFSTDHVWNLYAKDPRYGTISYHQFAKENGWRMIQNRGAEGKEDLLPEASNSDLDSVATLRSSFGNSIQEFIGEKVSYDKEGQIIWGHDTWGNLQHLLDVRGWGAIQNIFKNKEGLIEFDEASKFQDEFAEWIVSAINSKLSSKQLTLTVPVAPESSDQ